MPLTSQIQNFAPILPLALLMIFGIYKHKDLWHIGLYVALSLTVNLSIGVFQQLYLGPFFLPIVFGLLVTLLTAKMIFDYTNRRSVFIIGSVGFIITFLCYALVDGLNSLPLLSASIYNAFVLVMCIYYFFHVYENETDLFIGNNLQFQVVAVLFIYSAGAAFTFLLLDVLASMDLNYLWQLHDVLSIISMLGFSLVIWNAIRSKKIATPQ